MERLEVAVVDSKYLGNAAYFDREKGIVDEVGGEFRLLDLKTDDQIVESACDADILLCCGNPPITRKVLENFQGKVVMRYGIGVNSVDLEAATACGKIIYNSPGFCKEELVMHAAALILACQRNIGFYNQSIKRGEWPKGKGPEPRRLSKQTVGLFGFGDSARPMADVFGKGFHSRVIAYDPFMDEEAAAQMGVQPVDFDTLLRESDVISIHAPLNKDTFHIFNRDAFKKMKNTAMIANVSRGGLVCEADLIEALQAGEIGYAGLDVLETEPVKPDNPLLKMDNVVLTPHSGFYGVDAVENGHLIASHLLREYVDGKIVRRNVTNRDVLPKLSGYEIV